MPGSVLAAVLQLLLASTFFVVPIVALVRGGRAQRAAEVEVTRQGFPAGVLAARRLNFGETGWQFVLAEVIAAGLAVLGVLNLAGSGTGRVLSWVAAPIVLVVIGCVTGSQVFARRFVVAAFGRFADTRGIDAGAVVDAAQRAYPPWLRPVVIARFLLATLGSVGVIVSLAAA